MKKKIALLIWTTIVLIGIGYASVLLTKNIVYTGNDLILSVNANRTLSIDQPLSVDTMPEIILQAASSGPFQLRRLGGETLSGNLNSPPFDWYMEMEKYYYIEPSYIQGGQWLITNNGSSVTLRLTSIHKITITEEMTKEDEINITIVVLLIGAIVWLAGYTIGDSLKSHTS